MNDDADLQFFARWDYYGPISRGTAEHFQRHLIEFLATHSIHEATTGVQSHSATHCETWCRTDNAGFEVIQARLKPHRWDTFQTDEASD